MDDTSKLVALSTSLLVTTPTPPLARMPGMKETRGSRVRQRREELGISQTEVGKACGVKQQTINNLELDKVNRPRYLDELAVKLDCTKEWIQHGLGKPDKAQPTPGPPDRELTLPVMGTGAGGHEGAFQMSSDPIEYVRRQPGLVGVTEAYALYVVGDSMEHRFYHGELVCVAPSRPCRPGDFVVLQTENYEGAGRETWVKRYLKEDSRWVHVEQFNPPRKLRFKLSVVQAIHRILTPNELVGA